MRMLRGRRICFNFLLGFRQEIKQRRELLKELRRINLKPTFINLISGGPYKYDKKRKILELVMKYIKSTKILNCYN